MTYDYDFLVIGGGSGGIAAAKRASKEYGKKVGVIERARLGGTCVNVGCVPKKVSFIAANIAETIKHEAKHYCFKDVDGDKVGKIDYPSFKKKRDDYVKRLNDIYASGFVSAGVTNITGDATFVDKHTLKVTNGDSSKLITSEHILIATGGRPLIPGGEGVAEYSIDSDGFFEMEDLPKVVVVVGAGYIAVELAGVLNALGCETHLVVRKEKAIRNFDPDISNMLNDEMIKSGIIIHRNTNGVDKIALENNKVDSKIVTLKNGDTIYGVNVVLMAAGRIPNTETLNLEGVGVEYGKRTYIKVDEYSNTSVDGIYALGDVVGDVELTPMAIAAGRRLSDRLFSNMDVYKDAKVSYENVPTVMFTHPTIGTIGMTEPQAIEAYGADNIKIYKSTFVNMYYSMFDDVDREKKPKTLMKIICAGIHEKVIGLHVIGMGADEMIQGFGVAMKMGCTKADLDSCIAIHPTASEELVTMGTWGTSPPFSGAIHSPLNGSSPSTPILKEGE